MNPFSDARVNKTIDLNMDKGDSELVELEEEDIDDLYDLYSPKPDSLRTCVTSFSKYAQIFAGKGRGIQDPTDVIKSISQKQSQKIATARSKPTSRSARRRRRRAVKAPSCKLSNLLAKTTLGGGATSTPAASQYLKKQTPSVISKKQAKKQMKAIIRRLARI